MSLATGQSWSGATAAAWGRQCAPNDALGKRLREITYEGRGTLALAAHETDVAPLTPNSNPRAQLCSPRLIDQGATYRVEVSLNVPSTALPATLDGSAGAWVEFVQFDVGPPFAGSPPLRIMTQDGVKFGLREADGWPYPWYVPLVRDSWWTFRMDFLHAVDGWYELSVGQDWAPPKVVVPRKPYACVQPSNDDDACCLYLDAYMQAGTADRIGPFYFTGAKVTRLA